MQTGDGTRRREERWRMAELLPRHGPFSPGRGKNPPGCPRPSSAQVPHYLVLIVVSPVAVTSPVASVHRRARTAADLPPCPAVPSPQTKPHPSKGTEQTNLGSHEWSWSLQNGLPALPGRVCQGRLPRENQTQSWLGIVSACKHFHATSAALN